MISAFGMFNALVMSYSRLPLAMAQDGMLPQIFGKLHPTTRAPWVAIMVCAVGMGAVPGTWIRAAGDDRHPAIRREPGAGVRGADYPARERTGLAAALSRAGRDVWRDCGRHHTDADVGLLDRPEPDEQVMGMSSFAFGMILIGGGVVAYCLNPCAQAGWMGEQV